MANKGRHAIGEFYESYKKKKAKTKKSNNEIYGRIIQLASEFIRKSKWGREIWWTLIETYMSGYCTKKKEQF